MIDPNVYSPCWNKTPVSQVPEVEKYASQIDTDDLCDVGERIHESLRNRSLPWRGAAMATGIGINIRLSCENVSC
jgi:hypothetical protein